MFSFFNSNNQENFQNVCNDLFIDHVWITKESFQKHSMLCEIHQMFHGKQEFYKITHPQIKQIHQQLTPSNSNESYMCMDGLCFENEESFLTLFYYYVHNTKIFSDWHIKKIIPKNQCNIIEIEKTKLFPTKNVFIIDSFDEVEGEISCSKKVNNMLSKMNENQEIECIMKFPEFLFFKSNLDEKLLNMVLEKTPSFMKNINNIEEIIDVETILKFMKTKFPESISWINVPSSKLAKEIIDYDKNLFYFLCKKANSNTIDYAIRQGCLINGLEKNQMSFSLKMESIKNNPMNLLYFKQESLDGIIPTCIVVSAFEKNPNVLPCIPLIHLNKDMCMKAIEFDAYNIIHTPFILLDETMCKMAVQKNVNMYDYVPDELKTMNLKLIYYKKMYFG